MKCLIKNSCKYKNLCCAKCKKKNCPTKCLDSPDNCKYFEDIRIDLKIYNEQKSNDKEKKDENKR